MNDHGYRAHDAGIFKNYIDKQTQLVALLKTNGSRVALVTPQPIEDKRPDPDKDVRNDSLRKMSDGLREVQLYGPPEWVKSPAFEAARDKELSALDAQIAQLETKINALRQPLPHTFVLKPAAP